MTRTAFEDIARRYINYLFTYFKYFSAGLGSVFISPLTMGLGAATLAIRRKNGPIGAVHSSNVIL